MKLIQGKIASLDVDAQYGFTSHCPQELPVPHGDLIGPELNAQAELADFRVGSKDAHPRNAHWVADHKHPPLTPIEGKHMDVRWPAHCVPGTKGFELLSELPHPSNYDYFVWKGIEPDMHPYSACYHDLEKKLSTGLIEFLKAHHVALVIVGGLATEYCVKDTVLHLLEAGFTVMLNKAGCRGLNPKTTMQALREMKQKGVILVESASQIKAFLQEEA